MKDKLKRFLAVITAALMLISSVTAVYAKDYYCGAHTFARQNITSGKKEFSAWSNYKKIGVL